MNFKIEYYEIYISQMDEAYLEFEIMWDGEFICGNNSCTLLELSQCIKKIIIKNELNIFGYIRFVI